jgi:hypothetical protein
MDANERELCASEGPVAFRNDSLRSQSPKALGNACFIALLK